MSNEEIKRAILEMDEREELAKDMLEQVRATLRLICIDEHLHPHYDWFGFDWWNKNVFVLFCCLNSGLIRA